MTSSIKSLIKNWQANKWIKLYRGLKCKQTDRNLRLKSSSVELEICSWQFEESWWSSFSCFTTKIKKHFLSVIHPKSQWLFPSVGFKWNVELSLEVLLLGQLYCYRTIPITGMVNIKQALWEWLCRAKIALRCQVLSPVRPFGFVCILLSAKWEIRANLSWMWGWRLYWSFESSPIFRVHSSWALHV